MSHRFVKVVAGTILPRLGVCLFLIGALIAVTGRVHAAGTVPSASPTTPTASPTTGCNNKLQHCSNGPTPNFLINPGDTGKYAHGKTSISYCNGQVYVGWTDASDDINISWGSTGGAFSNTVHYIDTVYNIVGTSQFTAPALACWRAASGQFSDQTRLWIAFTGTDKKLYYGYFNGTGDNGGRINYHQTVPNQASVFSPALSVQGTTLRIGWVGVNNRYLNFESTNDAATWFNINTIQSETASAGFGMAIWCPGGSCSLWFAWPGTDSGDHIYVGYFSFTAGWKHAASTADYTCTLCELTLVPQGGTLRIPYAGGGSNLNVDNSTNGSSWSNDQSVWNAVWGVGGAVDGQGHLWLTWTDFTSTQIEIGTYN